MSFVIDSSVTVAWYFPDEGSGKTDAIMTDVARRGGAVPAHWRIEVANAFLMAVRRKRIDAIYRDQCLAELALLPVRPDPDSDTHAWSAVMMIADLYKLTAYDAAYLELAQRKRVPLATLDEALAKAANAAGVETLGL